jgi:hypothetical protein
MAIVAIVDVNDIILGVAGIAFAVATVDLNDLVIRVAGTVT